MFFSKLMFSKRGSLAKVWLAAHHQDKKVSKTAVVATNIEESVHDIVEPLAPLALRLSGQLLLGVVRIYQRKAKYLQEDCNDALTKIKMSFRPGAVNLPLDMSTASASAITSLEDGVDLEIPEGDLSQYFMMEEDDAQMHGVHVVARDADITLDEPLPMLSSQADPFADDADIGSGDEEPIELLEPMDDFEEFDDDQQIEVARDAGLPIEESFDLGIELDDGMQKDDDIEMLQPEPEQEELQVPLEGGLDLEHDISLMDDSHLDVEPLIENSQVELDAGLSSSQVNIHVKRKRAPSKLIFDTTTQLKASVVREEQKDTSAIVCVRQRADLTRKRRRVQGNSSSALLPPLASSSMAPELLSLLQKCLAGPSHLPKPQSQPQHHDEPLEQQQHAEHGYDMDNVDLMDVQQQFEEPPLNEFGAIESEDLPQFDDQMPEEPLEPLPENQEPIVPIEEVHEEEAAEPQAADADADEDIFQGHAPSSKPSREDQNEEAQGSSWSERTKKMYHLLSNRMPTRDSSLSLSTLVNGKSRSTVAGVFLEMLVLKTHDYIELKQDHAYSDISIHRTARFDEPLPRVEAQVV